MATKSTYLVLINKILKRIQQAPVLAIPATGHAAIISELINEAQNYLYSDTTWFTLMGQRTWKTYLYTASTIAFVSGSPSTITDSANGFGQFVAGQTILVSGSTNNSFVMTINTAAAGTLTLNGDESIVSATAGGSITLTAVTYPVASDFGRCLSLQDITNSIVMIEDTVQDFTGEDPQQITTSNPTNFAIDGMFYRLYPIPSGVFRMRERYVKIPPALSATTDTSILPIECENCMIHYVYYQTLNYLQKYDVADRERIEFEKQLARAKASNFRVLDQWHRMTGQGESGGNGIGMPKFPSQYGPRYM